MPNLKVKKSVYTDTISMSSRSVSGSDDGRGQWWQCESDDDEVLNYEHMQCYGQFDLETNITESHVNSYRPRPERGATGTAAPGCCWRRPSPRRPGGCGCA